MHGNAYYVINQLSFVFGKSVKTLASQLQGLLSYAPMIVLISDQNGKILTGSNKKENSFLDIYDSLPEIYSKNLNRKIEQQLKNADKKVLQNGSVFNKEIRFKKDQNQIYIQISKFPIERDHQGNVISMCTFIYDITERIKAQETLQEAEDTFMKIFELSSDPVLLIKDNIFIECNKAALTLLGYNDKGDFLNKKPEELSPEYQSEGIASTKLALEKLSLAQKQGYARFDWIHLKKDDSYVFVDVTLTKISIRGESLIYVTWRDMTEKIKNEEEKDRLQSQLIQAQKMESIGRLAGGVAHDFNNMLSVINGYADLALRRLDKEDALYVYMNEILTAGNRSAELTQQLLAFARKQDIKPQVIDLNDSLQSMYKMLTRLIGEDIDLSIIPGQSLWYISMDPSQLNQILANLVVNARDAIDGVGRITIETSNVVFDELYCQQNSAFYPGEYVSLIVTDTGHGINSKDLDNIFEPFFTTKEVGKGTGLGLATVYGIVKQNHGFINVYSELKRGTSFKIYFPKMFTEKENDFKLVLSDTEPRGSETILVIEDEISVLNYTKMITESLGYKTYIASTPSEALLIFNDLRDTLDLVITDVIMPVMNGKDLIMKIQEQKSDIKYLFMSGYTANVIDRHGVLSENVSFIQKPFTLKALAHKIRETLDR